LAVALRPSVNKASLFDKITPWCWCVPFASIADQFSAACLMTAIDALKIKYT